jgi:hypothetical protein
MTVCVVITRDRVSYTRACVASLEQHGLDIHLVDHGSTWPSMLDYLNETPYPVHYLDERPPRALWDWDGLRDVVGSFPYLVTDPDVVIDPDCPADWLQVAADELAPGGVAKVGLGLRVDDLPDTALTLAVREWEAPFSLALTASGRAYRAPVDTTLALHPPLYLQPKFRLGPAARLAPPYLIRHLPWYGDLDPDETAHYRGRAIPGSSHWINGGWP